MPAELQLVPSVPSQRFRTTNYVVDVYWNERSRAWFMNLMDDAETPIRMGMKLVLGAFPGRRSVDPLFPPGVIVVVDTAAQSDAPGAGVDAGLDDLGTRVKVYFYSGAEILAAAGAQPGDASAA